jgi:phage anti-repressor protein
MDENLNIVKLIEKNPITRLSKDYQNALVKKIQSKFTDSHQQMFTASFFCYLKYDSKNDFVIELDDIWKWIGFSRKDPAKVALKKNFVENIDYKIISQKSLEKSKSEKGRPEEQILLTINTFKKFCLKAGTKKADEIHDYYIKLEELLHETIDEQTSDLKNQLLSKDSQLQLKEKTHKQELKKEKHNTLVELLKTKKCVYVREIKEGKFIKIGSTKQIDGRDKSLAYEYNNDSVFLEVFECENFREVEENIFDDPIIIKNLYKNQIKNNGKTSKEVVELSENFTYDQLISIVKKHVNNSINSSLTSNQLLEKQKMELEKRKMDHELLLTILKSDKNSNKMTKIMEDLLPDLLKNISLSINKDQLKEEIEEQIKEETQEQIKGQVKEEVKKEVEKQKEKIKEKIPVQNPNNNLLIDAKISLRKPKGRKIQKIDPKDLTKVVKIYDSMMFLLRSPENERFKKPCMEKAIKNNLIYKDYRWNYVEEGDDPKISKAKPTTESKTQNSDIILQLNDTKTEILDSFSTKKELKKKLGIGAEKLKKIIQNGTKFNNHYFVLYSDCPKLLLDNYNGSTIRIVKASNALGPIKRIDPITKGEIIFNTFDEINVKLGFRRPTIKKAIENKTMWGGFLWEFCDKK